MARPVAEVKVVRISRLHDSVVVLHGRRRELRSRSAPWLPYEERQQYYYPRYQSSRADALRKLREDYPDARLEGFDQPAPPKAVGGAALPGKRPRDTRRASLLAALAVGAMGWLLGRKRPA